MRQKNRQNYFDIIIVGGGASGLFAGSLLSGCGKRVLILEKMRQCGLKLRLTGKGRCNLTNTLSQRDFMTHCSNEGLGAEEALKFFSNQDTIDYFEHLGLPLVEERGRRVFPKSGKSIDVFLTLVSKIERSENVEIMCNHAVEKLLIEQGCISGVVCRNKEVFRADKVLLCCGGESYPDTGSDGDGIRLAKQSGHQITTTMPTLVGLRTLNAHPQSLQNYLVKNVYVSISNKDGKVLAKDFGDIHLDEYGLAGPVILRLSRKIAENLYRGEKLFVSTDMKPKVSKDKLLQEVKDVLQQRMGQTIESVLRAWLPKELIADYKFITKKRKALLAKENQRMNNADLIVEYLKDNKDEIIGDMGWYEAIITKGGVDLSQINLQTMQSKKVKGLYFAGEVLDIDADTGGFNLQIAFSTAALACKNLK